jgi:hypothetical protein
MKPVRSETNFQIIQCDAAKYPIRDDENVFFMFNPFDRTTMQQVWTNLSRSLSVAPRHLILIFNNLRYPDVIHSADFSLERRDYVFGGHNFAVYVHDENSGSGLKN